MPLFFKSGKSATFWGATVENIPVNAVGKKSGTFFLLVQGTYNLRKIHSDQKTHSVLKIPSEVEN